MTGHKIDFNILPTKLNRPVVDQRWVPRPRLIKALDSALSMRVTLLSASAGYGKTTLVAQWLDHTATPSAWLSLDRHDSDPDRFLKYWTAAVRRIFPDFGLSLNALCSATVLPPPEHIADTMISELTALKKPLVIVFEDFHTIKSEPVQNIFARVVKYQPDNLHLVISTRIDPPFSLAQWRVRNWMMEFRAADLRFSNEEAQTFFAKSLKTPLSAETVGRLQRRTEGWITGLQLARLSMTDADNPDAYARSFTASDRNLIDYLIEEVVAKQPVEIRDFLAVSAMFNRFCASLCDAVMGSRPGRGSSRELISALERENLFLVPIDSERIWYRYHHLFQNLLKQHLTEKLSPDDKVGVNRLAGKWFAGQGLIEEALTFFLAAGDVNAAAEQVELNLSVVLDQDLSRRTLRRWLEMFPAPALKQQPALAVALVYCKMFHWDFNETDQLMDAAEAGLNDPAFTLPESRRQKLLADVDTQRGFYLYWNHNSHAALKYLLRALKNLSDAHPYTHHAAVLYAALAHAMTGARDKGLQLAAEAISTAYSTGSPYIGAYLFVPAGIHYYAGDLAGTEQMSEKILALHDDRGAVHTYWRLHAHWLLGCVAYERNRLDDSAAHFQSVEHMPYQVNTRPYHDSLIGLALVALARGDTVKAREYAEAARDFAVVSKDAYSTAISEAFEIRMNMASHRVPTIAALQPPSVDSNQIFMETPSLTYAEHLLCKADQADHQAGLAYAQNAVEQLRQHHNTRQLIQFMAVNAVALHCVGRLEGALIMAQPLGFLRTFVDRGQTMATLLQAFNENMPAASYARRILDAFGDEAPITQSKRAHHASTAEKAQDPPMETLSRRERTVLAMLETSLANKEIADRLFVSPETVKKHIHNIYRKLNVHSRLQAIAKARKIGLLAEK